MNLTFTGEITFISKAETGTTAKGDWTKTSILVEEKKQYPTSFVFDAFNKSDQIKDLKVGDLIEVFFNAKAAEYKGKYYNGLSLWKVEVKENANKQPNDNNFKPEDDLPF